MSRRTLTGSGQQRRGKHTQKGHKIEFAMPTQFSLSVCVYYVEALVNYNHVLARASNDAAALRSRMKILKDMQRYDEALRDSEQLMKLAPNDIEVSKGSDELFFFHSLLKSRLRSCFKTLCCCHISPDTGRRLQRLVASWRHVNLRATQISWTWRSKHDFIAQSSTKFCVVLISTSLFLLFFPLMQSSFFFRQKLEFEKHTLTDIEVFLKVRTSLLSLSLFFTHMKSETGQAKQRGSTSGQRHMSYEVAAV